MFIQPKRTPRPGSYRAGHKPRPAPQAVHQAGVSAGLKGWVGGASTWTSLGYGGVGAGGLGLLAWP